ncbi:hypothetical protein C351_03434 [Cryptococcus neoformans c8]|nr:hypothetical protein C353_03712 [Cryptococcus neoformans var. grubii AD1-83a]OXG57659.1 hypothetical protein C354_03647 [Cryptococcus neoformans var. grubii MW-RSA1955]OXG62438.1 hypothetical protein C352_03659 [Cryptococcus neoformans var. grubii CHC193]OXG62740.1 hypothetical protein C351_03434 [Cryptococcus neoformans var. grubii c8]OXH09496.1 hypothetical protein C369_03687 [Cryptococcus neoformans var. grubii A5-35-17]OXH11031.1 hypothetical protein C370_03700 [Cryptococcus neoformans 
MSEQDTPKGTGRPLTAHSPPLPSNSTSFSFACRCLNAKIDGRVSASDEQKVLGESEGGTRAHETLEIFLPTGSEGVKFADYVAYDQDIISSREDKSDSAIITEGSSEPSWRKCFICDTRCYRVKDKVQKDPAAEEEWVTVELDSGVVYGEKLSQALGQEGLPFSGLLFDPQSGPSNFGRPPTNPSPSSDPDSYLPSATPSTHYVPTPHDPFFLPPPFIPSNQHLKDLCDQAENYLKEAHGRLEDEVRHFISLKTLELRDLEEKVRGEVELLWDKYKNGPGKEEISLQRSASTGRKRESSSRAPEPSSIFPPPKNPQSRKSFQTSPPPSHATPNPIMQASIAPATSALPNGTSLLAHSLSQASFFPQPAINELGTDGEVPEEMRDEIDHTISEVAKTYGKKGDSRAVAMSYIFSSFAENMGGATQVSRMNQEEAESPENTRQAPNKDSWIDQETATARMARPTDHLDAVVEEDSAEGATPRPKQAKQLQDDGKSREKGKKGKERAKVKFEEPEKPGKSTRSADGDKTPTNISEDEDYVFDFELEDRPPEPVDTVPFSLPHSSAGSRNMLEANLSHTFAADLPSHRAAWRRIEQNGSMYEALRGGRRPDTNYNPVDDSEMSKFATSVPIAINPIRAGQASVPVALERKTSLTDRPGIFVPGLRPAMREKGVARSNSLGLGFPKGVQSSLARGRPSDQQRKASRSASVSREREAVQSYAADPGAVFETLADGEVEEEEEEEDATATGKGTVMEKGFVPPHVLARQEDSKKLPDVGWRSLAS